MRNPIESAWVPSVLDSAVPGIILPKREVKAPFLETEAAISSLDPSLQELFVDLLEDSELRGVVVKVRKRLKRGFGEEGENRYTSALAGFLFELLAFRFLQKTIKTNERLLPPRETRRLYIQLFPGKEISDYDYDGLTWGIDGVTVPDGLLFARIGEIAFLTAAYEYSLVRELDDRKQKQTRYYTRSHAIINDLLIPNDLFRQAFLAKYLRNRYPGFPQQLLVAPNFKVIHVFPRDEQPLETSDEKVVFLPFSRKEFSLVLTGIFADIEDSLKTKKS